MKFTVPLHLDLHSRGSESKISRPLNFLCIPFASESMATESCFGRWIGSRVLDIFCEKWRRGQRHI
ncbi:hypothetical protein C5167_041923 [Papaver somniferum]|nr:hypothetical protein C5167_041923 [Papaver somniferum]